MDNFTIAIAGLGSRGREAYARCAVELDIAIVAVADTDAERVREAAAAFGIPADRCFLSADELLKQDKLADALLVCTQDENHYDTSTRAIRKGYHLLLEKPIATTEAHCAEIARVATEHERCVVVCHGMRYSPLYRKIKEVIDSGEIGEVVTINAFEGVGYYHHAHSFVRGAWRNSVESSPMILAKCCHDVDMLIWLTGKRVKNVSSFGGLYYFRKEKAPEGAAERCIAGCLAKESCPYDAERIYFTDEVSGIDHGNNRWPANVLAKPVTVDSIRQALETGPYGRCVFNSDNDVVDHQVVNIEFENDITAHLTMTAFTPVVKRMIKVMGTLGMIEGDTWDNAVKTSIFGGEVRDEEIINDVVGEFDNHGGNDVRLFKAFARLLTTGESDKYLTSIDRSVESHLVCFAAERSRLNGGTPERMI